MTLFVRHKRDWLDAADECEANVREDERPPLEDYTLDDSRVTNDKEVGNGDSYGPTVVDDEFCDSNNVNTTPATVPLCVLGEVQLRFLCPDDLEEVRALCQVWFPIGKFI